MLLSLVLTYYENPHAMSRHVALLQQLPEWIKQRLEVVVVDDGSQRAPLTREVLAPLGQSTKVIRIEENKPWNHRVARNIGVREAHGDWVLLLDIDTLCPEASFAAILSSELESNVYYWFTRTLEGSNQPIKVHHDSILISRQAYLKVGGYDERFTGIYGAAGRFLKDLKKFGLQNKLFDAVIHLVPDSAEGDARTNEFPRSSSLYQRNKVRMIFYGARLGIIPWRSKPYANYTIL